jgi:LysM repeat protein
MLLLVVVVLTLAACERDRPAPTASGTPGTPGTPGVLQPVGTQAPGTDAAGQTLPTPVPLDAVTATPALRPVATTATQPQPAAGAQAAPGTYTVQRGDSLGSIAQRFGVKTKDILAVNPSITNPDVLAVGQQIKLPSGPSLSAPAASSGSSGATQGAATGNTYVVQRGDTLSTIAKRLGVTLAALQQANNISNPDRITVGQKLVVPGGGAAPAASSPTNPARTYTVRKGDTMSSIAVKFGITVAQLQAANGISDPNKITVGAVLKIP